MRYIIRGGLLLDAGMDAPQRGDLIITDGVIEAVGRQLSVEDGVEVIDADGLWVTPGLHDAYVEALLRGGEPRETISSAAAAAQAGGYSRWNLLPQTEPTLDNATAVATAQREAFAAGADVGLIGALTVGNLGKQLSPLAELAAAGVVAFSDGGRPIADTAFLRKAMTYSADFGLPLLLQPDDVQLSSGATAHDGAVSMRLGLPGSPAAAEAAAVARIIALAELTGARVHLTRISTAAAVDQLRAARRRGAQISASVTAHHLLLDERWLLGTLNSGGDELGLQPAVLPPYDSSTRVWPPLREAADRAALRDGLADGTLTVLASDHSPRLRVETDMEYGLVRPGISSLETTVSVGLTLVNAGQLSAQRFIAAFTDGPAQLYGQPQPRLTAGAAVGLTLLAPQTTFRVDPATFRSRGRNTPLRGQQLTGTVRALWLPGGWVTPAR